MAGRLADTLASFSVSLTQTMERFAARMELLNQLAIEDRTTKAETIQLLPGMTQRYQPNQFAMGVLVAFYDTGEASFMNIWTSSNGVQVSGLTYNSSTSSNSQNTVGFYQIISPNGTGIPARLNFGVMPLPRMGAPIYLLLTGLEQPSPPLRAGADKIQLPVTITSLTMANTANHLAAWPRG